LNFIAQRLVIKNMRSKLLQIPVITLTGASLLISGCASTDPSPGTATVVGSAGIGAGTGAAIGKLATGDDRYAAIGALAGAAAGALTGAAVNEVNKSKTAFPVAERTRNNPNYAISPFDGSRLYVGNAAPGSRLRDPQGRVFILGN
jgi:hypothetical protein